MPESPAQRTKSPKRKPQPRRPARTTADWDRQEAAEPKVSQRPMSSTDKAIVEVVGDGYVQVNYSEDGFRLRDGRRFNVSKFFRFKKAVVDFVANEAEAVGRKLAVEKSGYAYLSLLVGRDEPKQAQLQDAFLKRLEAVAC